MPSVPLSQLRRRLERLGAGPVGSGRIGVTATAALERVGFHPVSEVMGATALVTAPLGFFGGVNGRYPRGWQGGPGETPPVHLSSGQRTGPASVRAQRAGMRTALGRLTDEIRAVGGDGVVDVRIERGVEHGEGGLTTWTFLATGTAVRSIGRTHPDRPFTSALSATQTVAALQAGWVPVALLYCPVAAARWVEPGSRQQERISAPNGEITAYTETVTAARRRAVRDLQQAAARAGADGAVLSSFELSVGSDLTLAEVSVLAVGTALLQLPVPARPPTTDPPGPRVRPVLALGALR